uniref:Uncharacterized protein n=1 Tax=Oryza meridionalis TaxID=40149 RepID=A0A0E0DR25_9ORYZ
MGQANSAQGERLGISYSYSAGQTPANSAQVETLGVSYPAGQTPEENLAKALARWREKLRAPGRAGLPPADYSYIKIGDVCDESAAVLSRLRELGASEPACVYYGDVTSAQADLSLGRLSLSGGAAARHVAESFTDDELDGVIDDGYDGDDGLEVPVFDEEGRRYDFRCGYNDGFTGQYQLVGAGGDYQRLMANNNVVRDVAELGKGVSFLVFTFRSAALLTKHKWEEDHEASGALCMVILFFVSL